MDAPLVEDGPLEFRQASQFSLKDLTIIYNQTRVDYLVPMPMNMAKMAEYIRVYDIDLESSFVAMEGEAMVGLGMLGVRPGRAWITRLGVLPTGRRRGVGLGLMQSLQAAGERLGRGFFILEVIKNNLPAHQLFLKLGYHQVGELVVLRRPPGPTVTFTRSKPNWLNRSQALALLETRPNLPPWTNQTESLTNAEDVFGLTVTLPGGESGWLVFQRQRFALARFVMQTLAGEPVTVARELLAQLHDYYFDLDTNIENLYVNDPHLPAFYEAGYIDSFGRIEMYKGARPTF